MSSGPFLLTFYETDLGNVCTIKVQPETIALQIGATANDPVTGPATAGFPSAQTGQSRRAIGINARRIRCVYEAGASGDLPGLSIVLPWLNPATYATIAEGTSGTYNGEPVQFRRRLGEAIN